MNRLTVPATAVEPLRAAMTCERCEAKVGHKVEDVCPPRFWIGVAGGAIDNRIGPNFGKPLLPAPVRAMLGPCQCGGPPYTENFICEHCGNRGHPRVELVTDCPNAEWHHDMDDCLPYTLGWVTATGQVLPIMKFQQWRNSPRPRPGRWVLDDGGGEYVLMDNELSDITVVPLADKPTVAVEVKAVQP
jgi:hypothetical protein